MSIYRAYSRLINEVRNPQKNTQRAEKLLETSLWKTYGLKVYSKTEHAIGDLRTIIDAYEDNPNPIISHISDCGGKYNTINAWLSNPFSTAILAKRIQIENGTLNAYVPDPTLFIRNKPIFENEYVVIYAPEKPQDSLNLTYELWINKGEEHYSPKWCTYSSYGHPKNKHPVLSEKDYRNYFTNGIEILVFEKHEVGAFPAWSIDIQFIRKNKDSGDNTVHEIRSKEMTYFDQSKNIKNFLWSEGCLANQILIDDYGVNLFEILEGMENDEKITKRQLDFSDLPDSDNNNKINEFAPCFFYGTYDRVVSGLKSKAPLDVDIPDCLISHPQDLTAALGMYSYIHIRVLHLGKEKGVVYDTEKMRQSLGTTTLEIASLSVNYGAVGATILVSGIPTITIKHSHIAKLHVYGMESKYETGYTTSVPVSVNLTSAVVDDLFIGRDIEKISLELVTSVEIGNTNRAEVHELEIRHCNPAVGIYIKTEDLYALSSSINNSVIRASNKTQIISCSHVETVHADGYEATVLDADYSLQYGGINIDNINHLNLEIGDKDNDSPIELESTNLRKITIVDEDNPYTDNTITLDLTKCKKLHTIENNVDSTFRYILPHKNVHVDDTNENHIIE